MAVTYPLSYPPELAIQKSRWKPETRQNVHDSIGGNSIAIQTAPTRWRAEMTSAPLNQRDYGAVRAWLALLEEGLRVFLAYDPLAPLPWQYRIGGTAYPSTWTGTLSTVATTLDTITIAGFDVGTRLRAGDYVAFSYGGKRALHQVMEDRAANDSGQFVSMEVRPHVRPGWVAGNTVTLQRPSCFMRLVPGSVDYGEAEGWAMPQVSFTGVQVPGSGS